MGADSEPNSDKANVEQWSNFADDYDRYRPVAPTDLIPLLKQFARVERPALVVDLGCGTGNSTRLWQDHTEKVIGIEPNDRMRYIAEAQNKTPHIIYQSGYGHNIKLADACADIVTVAHALHWMKPEPTIKEITRILRLGGVFAQVDFKWPPSIDWEIEQTMLDAKQKCIAIEKKLNLRPVLRYDSARHYELLQASNEFCYVNELGLHRAQTWNASQIVGLLKTDACFHHCLVHGVSEDELGLTEVRRVADEVMGDNTKIGFLYFRVRIAVK